MKNKPTGFEKADVIQLDPKCKNHTLTQDTIIDGDVPEDVVINTNGWRLFVTGTIFRKSLI